jgi:NADH:ubiquinone oxidoreductase subunit 6 (subunit J)
MSPWINIIKGLIVLLMLYGIVTTIQSTAWQAEEITIDTSPEIFGLMLFREALVAFEVASALLTASLIGALFLAMRENEVVENDSA